MTDHITLLFLVAWIFIALWQSMRLYSTRAKLYKVGVETWGNGYASALVDEGYSKGDAARRTMRRIEDFK